jgi:hypothetical protein
MFIMLSAGLCGVPMIAAVALDERSPVLLRSGST